MKLITSFIFILIAVINLCAQQLVINEVVSGNSKTRDEDGDSSDWFEIYNRSGNTINLSGYFFSDDLMDTTKWTAPDITLSPGNYLLLWASGKDRQQWGYSRSLTDFQTSYKYILPDINTPANWKLNSFNDSDWPSGQPGFGYGDGDDKTIVPFGTTSIFVRTTFDITDPADLMKFVLDIDYDDGFAAYINGIEIARSNIPGSPTFNTLATINREALLYQGGELERYEIVPAAGMVLPGKNTFAIQFHNVGSGSSDLSGIPFLSAIFNSKTQDGSIVSPDINLPDLKPHTNFKLNAGGETIYLFTPEKVFVDSLRTGPMRTDVSIGKDPISNELTYYTIPTPEAPNTTQGFQGFLGTEIQFSHEGGLINNPISLTLSGKLPGDLIYYTTDGREPDDTDLLYTQPITISQSTLIRAKLYRNGFVQGFSQSRSYVFGAQHNLPVLMFNTDPNNLFHIDSGMYVLGSNYDGGNFPYFNSNIWEDWERPVNITLYNVSGEMAFSFNAGAKIFGGWSRANDQRSFSLFARGKYGAGSFDYPIFDNLPYSSFETLVLRNSGNDFNNTQMRDATLTSMMRGSGVDFQENRPLAVYINNQYWGIYNIREKVDTDFIFNKHGIDPEKINLLEANGRVVDGSNTSYFSMLNTIGSSSLSNESLYLMVENQLDVEEMIKYFLAQIYFDNTDWPGNNIKFWNSPETGWRWILYDTDFGFGPWNPQNFTNNTLAFALEPNGPGWPNPPWSTYLFRKLMENIGFRNKFVNQFADELNSRFLPANVTLHIRERANMIRSEIPKHKSRWGGSLGDWESRVNDMVNFGTQRPFYVRNHIKNTLGLPSMQIINTSINKIEGGSIKLNSLVISEEKWTGTYFQTVPIQLTAIPKSEYVFSHWSGDVNSTNATISLDLKSTTNITANFTYTGIPDKGLVINEINYNSNSSWPTGDWIEIYNPNNYSKDVSGYIIRDSNDDNSFIMPENTIMEPYSFIVVCQDKLLFSEQNPEVKQVYGNLEFGLSSSGDMVRLFDPEGNLVDQVAYLPASPWPLPANGEGPTIELINPELDNALGINWKSGKTGGSPGDTNLLSEEIFGQIFLYPNPFDEYLNIDFALVETGTVSIIMYDAQGRIVKKIIEDNYPKGENKLHILMQDLESGLYIIRIMTGNEYKYFRVLKRD